MNPQAIVPDLTQALAQAQQPSARPHCWSCLHRSARLIPSLILALLLALLANPAQAHSFAQVYTLPMPYELYVWASGAALLLSFVILMLFVQGNSAHTSSRGLDLSNGKVHRLLGWLRYPLQFFSLALLLLCMATGFWGSKSPYGNFNMTFFWIVFVVGYAYLLTLTGNSYARLNPWQLLHSCLSWPWHKLKDGFVTYPQWLGYWPAVLFYAGLINLELFGGNKPITLATALATYTGLQLLGAWLFGAKQWFKHGELFAVFLGLLARMAPLQYEPPTDGKPHGRLRLQWPFVGLLDTKADHFSLLFFVLFMLSSTAFDGLHEARIWIEFYWLTLYKSVLSHWVGDNALAAFPTLRTWYWYWQAACLALSPFLYLAVFALFTKLSQLLGRSQLSTKELMLRFAWTLLPIALVYHASHYYTLLETQGIKVIALASDPFGWQWDLFGTKDWYRSPIVPDTGVVWHVQVGLIVVGHIISVWLAHMQALRTFATHRLAMLSQAPMLLLMMGFTWLGLWILSLPVKTAPG